MPRVLRKGNITLAPNWDLGADLRRTDNYDALLRHLTDEQVLIAKEIAVVEYFDRGDYFSSIHGDLGIDRRGLVVGLVMADDFKANWAEYGWRTIRGQGVKSSDRGRRTRIRNLSPDADLGFVKGKHILQRAARRAGLRVRSRRTGQ